LIAAPFLFRSSNTGFAMKHVARAQPLALSAAGAATRFRLVAGVAALSAALSCSPAPAESDTLPVSCQEALEMADATTVDRITQLSTCLNEPGLSEDVRSNLYGMLGALHLQRGEDEEALRYFDLVTQRSEGEIVIDFASFYLDRADLRGRLGRFEDALADLEIAKAITAESGKPEEQARVLRAETAILARQGLFEQALTPAQTLVALTPDDWSAHVSLGGVLQSLGRHADALAEADAAITLAPEHYAPHNNRCAVLMTSGDAEGALASCDKAVELGPEIWQAADSRAAVLAALGRKEDAAREYERAITLAPEEERAALSEALANQLR
jgi:tetratricopeptide (TPR) repeat protein